MLHFQHKNGINDAFQVCRQRATEVLVRLLSDVNRTWKPEIPHAVPVCYAMKGYSLDSNIMRQMCDTVLAKAHEKGIRIVCTTFDGQWANIAMRDDEGNPLTLMQLQRDVWSYAQSQSKSTILKYIENWRPS